MQNNDPGLPGSTDGSQSQTAPSESTSNKNKSNQPSSVVKATGSQSQTPHSESTSKEKQSRRKLSAIRGNTKRNNAKDGEDNKLNNVGYEDINNDESCENDLYDDLDVEEHVYEEFQKGKDATTDSGALGDNKIKIGCCVTYSVACPPRGGFWDRLDSCPCSKAPWWVWVALLVVVSMCLVAVIVKCNVSN